MSAAGTEGGRSQLCGVPGAQASRTCGSGVNGRHRPSQGMLVFQPWPIVAMEQCSPEIALASGGQILCEIYPFKKCIHIYLWLHWVIVGAQTFSSCGERGSSPAVACSLLVAVAVPWRQAPQLRHTGLAALQHVRSSSTRVQTDVL